MGRQWWLQVHRGPKEGEQANTTERADQTKNEEWLFYLITLRKRGKDNILKNIG